MTGFLRVLELYDGLLFLTTNRVGVFDDAILSRVHIQLFYPDLDHEKRGLVWDTFINKLRAERPKIRVEHAAKKYLHSEEMSMIEMNGREIRNGKRYLYSYPLCFSFVLSYLLYPTATNKSDLNCSLSDGRCPGRA